MCQFKATRLVSCIRKHERHPQSQNSPYTTPRHFLRNTRKLDHERHPQSQNWPYTIPRHFLRNTQKLEHERLPQSQKKRQWTTSRQFSLLCCENFGGKSFWRSSFDWKIFGWQVLAGKFNGKNCIIENGILFHST